MSDRLCLYALRQPDERLRETWLVDAGGVLAVQEAFDGGPPGPAMALPATALAAVFGRYARPLDGAPPPAAPGDAHVAGVRAFRFMRWGDVEPQSYLLYETAGAEPVAAPAPLVAAALTALARAGRGDGV